MSRVMIAIMVGLLAVVSTADRVWAGWLIYHKPAFSGRVIDAETKAPIEGAVVVVSYEKSTISVPHAYTSIIKIRETLTDKNGEWRIPSYWTIIQPFSVEYHARFLIYKPGYGNYPMQHVSPPNPGVGGEVIFSGELGTKGEVNWMAQRYQVTFGVVELPPLVIREDRLRALPSAPGDSTSKDLPILYKVINEERRYFKLSDVQG